MKARDVMTGPVSSLPMNTPIGVAAAFLTDHGFAAAPVTDEDGKLVGVVRETELSAGRPAEPQRRGWRSRRHAVPAVVGDLMISPVESMTPGANVSDVLAMMLEEHVEWVPIVDGHAVVGVITPGDLFRAGNPVAPTRRF